MNVPKIFHAGKTCAALIAAAAVLFFTGCRLTRSKPVIIWTDHAELASYVESFNASRKGPKAVIVYKAHLAGSIPPQPGETPPDLIIGSWLKNEHMHANFMPLDYLFSEQKLNPEHFYRKLLVYGAENDRQYLLPVSFNLPTVIFSSKNNKLVPETPELTTDELQKTAAAFNQKNTDGTYSTMGFAPSWNTDILYTIAKMRGVSFREKGTTFIWNQQLLDKTISYLRNWTTSANTSSSAEHDFSFKYLYTPDYKQVTSGRCLFAYTTSDAVFGTSQEQLGDIEFRWISQNGMVPVEDGIVTLGMYKKSRNTDNAEDFIAWLFKEDTQKKLLDRAMSMHLGTTTFGIAGGFSAIKDINERVFPGYYRQLLGNLPPPSSLQTPPTLPMRWASLKQKVVIPYLADAVNTNASNIKSMNDRITDWLKQYNF